MSQRNYEVYIAGPLFNAEENRHNKILADMFRDEGYKVFNPVEDGIEGINQTDISEDELHRAIFELDSERVRNCRIFIANLNGPQVDDGTATEIGIASESQRVRKSSQLQEGVEVMIGYFNDTRSLTHNMRRNPLPLGPFLREPNTVFDNREEIVQYAKDNFPPLGRL